jgi:hypothetical protein
VACGQLLAVIGVMGGRPSRQFHDHEGKACA